MPSTSLILNFALSAAAFVQQALALPQSSSQIPSTRTSSTARTNLPSSTSILPTATGRPAVNTTAPIGNSTGSYSPEDACGIIALAEAVFLLANPDAEIATDFNKEELPVDVVAACLQSVPLNKTAAVAFINWYKPYLEFQSTLVWLKNPPPSYQQSPVDLIGGLDVIASKVSNNQYKGEYEFELAIWKVLQSAHDGHLGVTSLPMLGVFAFNPPFTFVSLSQDLSSLPYIYVNDDISQVNTATSKIPWTPSPVTSINGQKAVDFLTTYAKDFVFGYVDPQADWNGLFGNAARTNAGGSPGFGPSVVIPADFNVTLTFANGSSVSREWIAATSIDLLGVETPQDFYDQIVAPSKAVNSDQNTVPAVNTPAIVPPKQVTTWGAPYPTPVIAQKNLTVGGYFTGYFLNASSTAVISLPSFDFQGETNLLKGFQDAVQSFLEKCKQANMKKLVIDLQANGGGNIVTGFDLFKQLFPTLEPFAGNQLRLTKAADIFGTTIGNAINNKTSDSPINNAYSFNGTLDITNTAFTSWSAMRGPLNQGGDQFTNLLRNSFSLEDPDFSISGYESRKNLSAQVFLAKDILLLTDGSCGSTCSIFAEEMHTQAGVKIVVVGGRPEPGPMQGVAGVRGSESLGGDFIQNLVNYTTTYNTSVSATQLPSLAAPPIRIKDPKSVTINLRNQLRKSKQDVPLQFIYQAADCKIWYTQAMLKNYEVLWQAAADAIWKNDGLCVQGSTNHPSAKPGVTTITAVPNYGNGTNTTAPSTTAPNTTVPITPYVTTGAAEGRSRSMGLSIAVSAGVLAIAASLL